MLRGVGRQSGLALGSLLRAHPRFAPLTGEAIHDWLPAELENPHSELSTLLRQNGFEPAFTAVEMIYRGGPLPEPPLPYTVYQDGDYDAVQALIARSFYDLRRAVGVKPHAIPPSEDERTRFAQNADDIFVLRQGGHIIAFVTAIGCEIDNLCVDEGHRGLGLAKSLVMHAVNHILQKGESPRLNVVDWNKPAYQLYEKLGFTDLYTTYLYRNNGL